MKKRIKTKAPKHQPKRQLKPKAKKAYTGKPRGFAAMSKALQLRIATMGGKTVSKNRKHMAAIGAVGGAAPHKASRKAK